MINPAKAHPRKGVRGAAYHRPLVEITPLGAANVELRAKVKRLRAKLDDLITFFPAGHPARVSAEQELAAK